MTGLIPTEICQLAALTSLRIPPASPTPAAPRDRPSASQVPRRKPDHRPDPDRDRPAHGAEHPASSPGVPDARCGARPLLGVAGASPTTCWRARSRPRSASSRRCGPCEFPRRTRSLARRATAPRRRRFLQENQITGPIPAEFGQLTALTELRVPPASPTPGAPRDRPSSQVRLQQQDHRHVPALSLRRPVLLRQVRQQPRRAVRLDGLLRSRGRRGVHARDDAQAHAQAHDAQAHDAQAHARAHVSADRIDLQVHRRQRRDQGPRRPR